MIIGKIRDFFAAKKQKEREELNFQRQWKEYNWEYVIKCLGEYWRDYRYLDEITKIIQPEEKRILDVGCGVVSVLNLLCNGQGEYFGIDPLMDDYRKLYPLNANVKWICSKGEKIPFGSQYFDIVICSNVLDHVENPAIVLKEISRVLKVRGKIVLTVDIFHTRIKRDAAHPFSFTETDVFNMLSDEFLILFSKKSKLNAQVMLYIKKKTVVSDNTQEVIIVGEKKG